MPTTFGMETHGQSYKPHEDRSIRCLAVFTRIDGPQEVGIPRVGARIDAVWNVGTLDGTLGPLAPLIENRVVALEAYSRWIPPGGIADAAFKGGWLAKSWWATRGAHRHGGRPPVVVVVTSERVGLRVGTGSFETVFPGIRRLEVGTELEILSVELADVPLQSGTTALHMLRRPSDDGSARVFEAFLADPAVDPEIRRRIEVEIMNGIIPSTGAERMTAADRVRAEGIEVGEKRGREIGEKRGREIGEKRGREIGEKRGREIGFATAEEQARRTVLDQVRTTHGDQAADDLAQIADFATLCARAFALAADRK